MTREESKVSTPPRALLSSAVSEVSLLHPVGEQVSLGPLGWVVMALSPTHILLDSGGSTSALLL